ncbi:DUF1007 family protein [Desulfoluna spongiiphila]|uniref:ABC-type uncharacterized transport system, substrate-binding protein n=1 Tax=Desulfoluna spongiiphila TaxID=419481 RepID=A0A1G5HD71_9BACT|nr:DUF1007 family protein [Desulfoluna spongiiphila]SCY61723.1 ABC-type uncharacterized transport system, substrate-binding protein [Desulfoluna spongiiphila]VVS94642.1 protein of unknown function duf1007 [Desulfoluna spongiiphila]
MHTPLMYTLILSIALALIPQSALRAHPHVFITSTMNLCYKAEQPVRLDVDWAFDDGFSAMILEDYDTNGDGSFSPKELSTLKSEAFDYLSEQHYFTFITHSGTKNHPVTIASFHCEAKDGIVVYRFSIPIAPLQNKGEPLRLSQYDPTNYSALFLSEDNPVTFSGDVPQGVGFTLRENTEETYYFGMLHPIEAVISPGGKETRP